MPGVFRRVLSASASALRGAGAFAVNTARAAYRPIFSSRRVYEDTMVGKVRKHLPGPMGKSDHYREKWNDIEGENNRGCKISEESFSSGHFKLKVPEHMVSHRALQRFMALSMSDKNEVIESRQSAVEAAFKTDEVIGDRILSGIAKKQCEELLILQSHLRKQGSDIAASSDPPGSNNVIITVKIDVNGKDPGQVQKEVECVFAAFGIKNPKLAKSVSENLIKDAKARGMEEYTSSADIRQPSGARERDHESSSSTQDEMGNRGGMSPQQSRLRQNGDRESGVNLDGLQAADFSLSEPPATSQGYVGNSVRGEETPAALQEEFLNRQGGDSVAGVHGGGILAHEIQGLQASLDGLAGVTSSNLPGGAGGTTSPTMLPPGVAEPPQQGRGSRGLAE